MKVKSATFTLGSSAKYFKSSVSLQVENFKEEDLQKVKKQLKKLYFEILAQEVNITKKLNKLEGEELKEYVESQLK